MIDLQEIIVQPNTSIKRVLEIIDKSSKQIVLVVDKNKKLIGTVNDGDVRRGLLKGVSLEDTVKNIYHRNPTVANVNDSKKNILRLATSKKLHQIPLIDSNGQLVGLDILDELIDSNNKKNKVVIMVGGLGTRLRPLTEKTPKAMLHVGKKPILQTIIEKFSNYGFNEVILSVNYKSHIIQDFFGDGSKFGVKIDYILEEKRMGTAGALSLLKEKMAGPFIVMNGDLLTNVNFEHLLDFHTANNAVATMCVREYDFQVPYGVVNVENGIIKAIEEKPIHKFFVSAGIYMLDSQCIDLIPKGDYYDMPTLFEQIIRQGEKTVSFPLREYWLDIGRIEEYEKANNEYHEVL